MDIITEATINGRRELEWSDMVGEIFHAKETDKAKCSSPHARWTMVSCCGRDGRCLAILCIDWPLSSVEPSAIERRQHIDKDSIAPGILWHKGPNTPQEPNRT